MPGVTSIGSPQNVIDDARNHLCANYFKAVQNEIMKKHPDATLVDQGEAALVQGEVTHQGQKAFYNVLNPIFFGRRQVPSRSDLYLFCVPGGKWIVEYRFDYPVIYDATDVIANFMRDLTWTVAPEK
jgi:hypothetical protein